MQLKLGSHIVEPESRYLTLEFRDSSDAINEPTVLRDRIGEDGYLFIRGFHDSQQVLAARKDILQILADQGKLDSRFPLMDGVVNSNSTPDSTSVRGHEALKTQSLKTVVYAQRTMGFFERFFGEPASSFNVQWLRTAGPGSASPIHCDMVYMGRGTKEMYTLWTPFGHVTPDMALWPSVLVRIAGRRSSTPTARTTSIATSPPASSHTIQRNSWIASAAAGPRLPSNRAMPSS